MKKFAWLYLLLFVASGELLPTVAFAHVGVGEASGFLDGLMHPVSGLDHICAMVAVGLWAAQMGVRSIWAVPITFVSVMVSGWMLGVSGISMPFAELGIMLSVLMLGVFIATSVRLPLWLSSAIVGLFAMCHGHTHGTEMPGSTSSMMYAYGFILSTVFLHIVGVTFGLGMHRQAQKLIVRLAGASIAIFGLYLAIF
ncbi:MAG: HupE/UreJ family protein [Nitrosomonadales bacterium]